MTAKRNIKSIGELAESLGLSRWTVSRVLNGHEGIHEKTKRRVLDEIERLNFQPNLLARSLRGGKTGLIGVCFQEMDTPILARKVSLLQGKLRDCGLRGIMEIAGGSVEDECEIIRHFQSLKVDGIILIGSKLPENHSIFASLKDIEMPLVAMDPANGIPVPQVVLNRKLAMKRCLKHFVKQGYNRFTVLGLEGDPVYGATRFEGLKEAAREMQLDPDDCLLSLNREGLSDWSFEFGYDLGIELLEFKDAPRAIIGMNDRVALGAIKAFNEAGFFVPEDFSIIGFDNQDVGKWIRPALSSISQNVEQVIDTVVETLQKTMDRPVFGPSNPIFVEPELVLRGTA